MMFTFCRESGFFIIFKTEKLKRLRVNNGVGTIGQQEMAFIVL